MMIKDGKRRKKDEMKGISPWINLNRHTQHVRSYLVTETSKNL